MMTMTAIVVTLMATGLLFAGVVIGGGTAVASMAEPNCPVLARVTGVVIGCGMAVVGVGTWYTFVFKVMPLMGV